MPYDAYEVSALLPAYTALSRFTYLSLVRLKLRPVGFPNRYLTHPDFNRAWQQLEMTVGGNTVFRRNTLLACGGFPQDEIFRTFGGEDAALGIALTRSSVVGTLFGEQDAAVRHTYRPNIHAERLLELALFGISDQKITTKTFPTGRSRYRTYLPKIGRTQTADCIGTKRHHATAHFLCGLKPFQYDTAQLTQQCVIKTII